MTVIFMAAPLLHITYYTANMYCDYKNTAKEQTPPFCQKNPPFFYGYIQKEYWNVQILNWVQDPSQAPQLIFVGLCFVSVLFWNIRFVGKHGAKNVLGLFFGDFNRNLDFFD